MYHKKEQTQNYQVYHMEKINPQLLSVPFIKNNTIKQSVSYGKRKPILQSVSYKGSKPNNIKCTI